MSNADVIKMVAAKLDEGIIITAVANSESKFDVSADGLIELSKAGVPQAVVEAVIKRASGKGPAPGATAEADDAMKPSDVLMIDGGETITMKYLNPQVRTAARGLGFGGMASYSVLRGPAAAFRTENKQPTFVIAVPDQAQAESYFTLASFAVRKNNSREVMVGGGYMSYSSGIHPDRMVAVDSVKADDQSKAPKGFTIYEITPKSPLATGEYAVVVYSGEMMALVGTWFTGTGNAYFDFGVDG